MTRRWLPATMLALLVCVACSDAARTGTPASEPSPSTMAERSTPTAPDREPGQPENDLSPVLAKALEHGPTRARTPARVTEQIVAAEDAVADPRATPGVLRAAARVQQLAYRQLGARHDWDARVRKLLPPRLHGLVADNVASRREFRSMHHDLASTLPAWRILRPAPAQTLLDHYRAAEREFGVGWEYLAAINLVESAMGRIRGTSVAGAQGPMQFIPTTWARWGRGDINSTRDSILAAGRYLASSGFTRPGGVPGALYSYNNHPAYVRGVTLLAEVMERRPRSFLGYYWWDVYYLTRHGDVRLPVGYESDRPIPVRRWLATHPQP